eukprot:CAMPEP_0194281852 /NCGR_PEP_ID=MMETSP0169-20130528/21718_1 /TAXON_ID=218684 /ORGANISM="Corethron pennatum, Strain L29A3" /LENGTH=809 /DNA_ID=CAMNT_0039027023 /DNA_START=770 /DNA_END=3199 /DNA_ORIENTATION=+
MKLSTEAPTVDPRKSTGANAIVTVVRSGFPTQAHVEGTTSGPREVLFPTGDSKVLSIVSTEVQMEAPTVQPRESASWFQTDAPVEVTKAEPICVRNSQCGEGLVCDTESGCEKVTCLRDSECSKFNAYCNEMEFCEQKKELNQLSSDSPSLNSPSSDSLTLSPNDPSSGAQNMDHITTGPTVGQKVENGRNCLVNDECLSGSCVQILSNKRLCTCKVCSTAGCSGCPSTKNCVMVKNKNYPRCEKYKPTFAPSSTGTTVTATEVPSVQTETVVLSRFSTEMPVEVTTAKPREVETHSSMEVEPTLFPMVSVKLDIGEVCFSDNECLSGACFIRLNWKRQGKCHCKTCLSAGCGGCSSTKNCKTISPLIPNLCFPYVPPPTEIPNPTKSPFSSPSVRPSYSPTISAKPVPSCVRNSQCGEGHVCDTESRCKKVTCWRDSECSKFDAYCNEIEICEKNKDPSQFPSYFPSLDFPSLPPTSSGAQNSDQSVLDLINDKTKNTIEEANVKAREAMSWYSELPSNMRLGVFAITFAITLAVFATVAWIGTWLVRSRSPSQLKGVDGTDDSSLDSIPFRRSNSFCVPAPESNYSLSPESSSRNRRSPSPSSVGSHKSNPYPISRSNSFGVPAPESNYSKVRSDGSVKSRRSLRLDPLGMADDNGSTMSRASKTAGSSRQRSLPPYNNPKLVRDTSLSRSGGSVKSQPSRRLTPLGMADDNGGTKLRASKKAPHNNPKLASDISLSRPRTLPRTNSNESRYRRTDSNNSRHTTSFQKPKSSVPEYYPASRSSSVNTSLTRNRSAPSPRNGKYRSPA